MRGKGKSRIEWLKEKTDTSDPLCHAQFFIWMIGFACVGPDTFREARGWKLAEVIGGTLLLGLGAWAVLYAVVTVNENETNGRRLLREAFAAAVITFLVVWKFGL